MLPNYFLNSPNMVRESECSDYEKECLSFDENKKMDIEEFFINKKIEKIVKTEKNLNEKLLEDIFTEKKKAHSGIFSEIEDEFFETINNQKYQNPSTKYHNTFFSTKRDLFQDILLPKKTEKPQSRKKQFFHQNPLNRLNFQKSSPNKRISFSTDESINKSESLKEIDGGCKCKNSNCLRLHCSCFKTLGFCGKNCKCRNCLNIHKYKKAREFVIQKTKFINKMAFREKTAIVENIHGSKIVLDGCNCSKGCKNNYCGCRKVGGKCSPICRCNECQNSKIFLSREEIQQIYKPYSRKKHKLVINFENSVRDKKDQNIKFEIYKK